MQAASLERSRARPTLYLCVAAVAKSKKICSRREAVREETRQDARKAAGEREGR